MKAIIICGLLLAGCAFQPMELSRMSDGSVCKLSAEGGPDSSQNAKAEADRRKLKCRA